MTSLEAPGYERLQILRNGASGVQLRIGPDPLGPVNKIVTLVAGERRIKSALAHIPEGAAVRLVRDEAYLTIREMFSRMDQVWQARGQGTPVEIKAIHPPGWRVEVDGRTVLTVLDADLQPPIPPTPIPWRRRARQVLTRRCWSAADALARRLGYTRTGHCDCGEDDW